MKTKVVLALLLFAGLAVRVNAQDNAKQQPVQQQTAEEARKNEEFKAALGKRILATRAAHMSQKTVQVNASQYNNREKEIFEKLNVDEIPANFPVYKSEYTNEQYTILMDKWYAANPTLVKTNTNEQK